MREQSQPGRQTGELVRVLAGVGADLVPTNTGEHTDEFTVLVRTYGSAPVLVRTTGERRTRKRSRPVR